METENKHIHILPIENDNFYCISYLFCTCNDCAGTSDISWNPYICKEILKDIENGVSFPVSKFEHLMIKNLWRRNGYKKILRQRIEGIKESIRIRDDEEGETYKQKTYRNVL